MAEGYTLPTPTETAEQDDAALRLNDAPETLDAAAFLPWGPDVDSSDLEFDVEIGNFFHMKLRDAARWLTLKGKSKY